MVYVDVLVVAGGLEVVLLEALVYEVKGDVDLGTLGRLLAVVAEVSLVACWIKRTPIMSVQRYQHHVLVPLHYMLRPIPMMHVPVHDRHFFLLPLLYYIVRPNRDTIVYTKPIDRVLSPRVMSWGADDCETILPLSLHQLVNPFQ